MKASAHELIRRHHAIPTRRIAQLCTCLLHSKTTVGCQRNPCAIDFREVRLSIWKSTSYAEPVQPCDGSWNEKHKSPLCTSTRESVCIPSSRDLRRRDQQTIAILHRWLLQSFKEVRTERELAWKSAPSLTTAFWTFRPEMLLAISE